MVIHKLETKKQMQPERFSLKVIFLKNNDMVYFSQLDLITILERALRRAELPLYFTQGFRPHVKMSFSRALKLGVEGQEEVVFYFTKKITPEELSANLTLQLPKGLSIIDIKPIN